MIQLAKGQIPPVLAANAAQWTAALVGKINAGQQPTDAEKFRYNNAEIKDALRLETKRKCAYCESKIGHNSYGHIEHVIPKSSNPHVWFSWDNLTLACEICNGNKGVREDIIDPYVDNPAVHLWIIGPVVYPAPGSDLGVVSNNVLKLNRPDLVDRRKDKLDALMLMLGNVMRTQNPAARRVLEADFLREIEDEKEFAALAREVLRNAQAQGILPP